MTTSVTSFRRAFLFVLIVPVSMGMFATALPAETEFRGLWVDSWGAGIHTPGQVTELVADARAGNFNAILPQVVRRGDAFYDSGILPGSTSISSDYDPLADLVQKAAAADPPIEVHPWIVVYPLWNQRDTPPPQPDHAYHRHPEWLTRNEAGDTWDGRNYQLDPGHPGVQQHVHAIAMEIVENYPVHGIHLDYIRYNGQQWGYNEVAVARFNQLHGSEGQPASDDPSWQQFRRDQVTGLVRRIYFSVLESRPEVNVSAATIGWGHGPSSTAGWTQTAAYATVFQDWRSWMEDGILDTNMPMFYFDFKESNRESMWAGWTTFAKDHKYGRHLSIGPGLYLNTVADGIVQIRSTREATAEGNRADGITGYSYRATNDEGVSRSAFLAALTGPSEHDPEPEPVFAETAAVPDLPWKHAPVDGHLQGVVLAPDGSRADGAVVEISGPETRTTTADARGFYGFVDLEPGTYLVTAVVSRSGMRSEEEAVAVEAGEIAVWDLVVVEGAVDEIIIDNPDATFQGSWFTGSAGTPYGEDYHWAGTTDGDADRTATYTPNIPVPGTYNVYAWYVPGGNRTDNARYDVTHRDGTDTVRVDQRSGGEEWDLIGSGLYFRGGTSGNVRISNDTGATGDVVIADAIRWELVEADPPPEPDDFYSGIEVSAGTERAEVLWTTAEPAYSWVDYGTTESLGASESSGSEMATEHRVELTGLTGGTGYFFRIRAETAEYEVVSPLVAFETVSAIILTHPDADYTGSWDTATFGEPYGDDYRRAWTVDGSEPTATATYAPSIAVSGTYDIHIWYTEGTNRSSDTPYLVSHADGETELHYDQRTGGGQWRRLLADVAFESGDAGFVRLGNNADGSVVIADAMKFVLITPAADPVLTVLIEGDGTVTRDPDHPAYAPGTAVELSATPESGYAFSHWSGDINESENPVSLVVDTDKYVTAHFIRTFAAWAEMHFSGAELDDPDVSGPDADPFGSGVTNLHAYAFGLDPRNPDLRLLPAMTLVGGELRMVYRRVMDDPSITYRVESTRDLVAWDTADDRVTPISAVGDGEGWIETVTLRVNEPFAVPGTFFRINVGR